MTASIMVQGAGSNVGKSVLVAGLCRYFASQGLKVMPFKPQNMSNNAAVTTDNGEIGRAQALQARAARTAAISDMNPVLLKPETDTGAQIIVQGTRYGTMRAAEYGKHKASLMP
ncbi:MAG: cobyric acid synthase CobQ, partial [Candidatus Puniceispirillales bacterium]